MNLGSQSKKTPNGFSLIELMVAVAIIGILATIAVPKVRIFQAKAKQSEAKALLGQMNTQLSVYHLENDAYTTDLNLTGGNPAQGAKYYTWARVTAADATSYEGFVQASANIICSGATADRWTINQDRDIANSTPISLRAC